MVSVQNCYEKLNRRERPVLGLSGQPQGIIHHPTERFSEESHGVLLVEWESEPGATDREVNRGATRQQADTNANDLASPIVKREQVQTDRTTQRCGSLRRVRVAERVAAEIALGEV